MPTTKVQRYKKLRKKGFLPSEAALHAGYGKETIDDRKAITDALAHRLTAQGLTTAQLAERIVEGLNAERYDSGAKSYEPDWSARHRYLETALKLRGDAGYKNRSSSDKGGGVNVVIVRSNGEKTTLTDTVDVTPVDNTPVDNSDKDNEELPEGDAGQKFDEQTDERKPSRVSINKQI